MQARKRESVLARAESLHGRGGVNQPVLKHRPRSACVTTHVGWQGVYALQLMWDGLEHIWGGGGIPLQMTKSESRSGMTRGLVLVAGVDVAAMLRVVVHERQ